MKKQTTHSTITSKSQHIDPNYGLPSIPPIPPREPNPPQKNNCDDCLRSCKYFYNDSVVYNSCKELCCFEPSPPTRLS